MAADNLPDNSILTKLDSVTLTNTVPLTIFFELTYNCNEDCIHCYVVPVHKKQLKAGVERVQLTADECKRTLDQMAEAGCMLVTFTGGEVLTRRDFFEIAMHAKKNHFGVRFFSNAILIDENKADKIRELNPMEVGISVYGVNHETHDFVTKVPGSFEKTKRAIYLLKERGVPINIKVPVMTVNFKEYGEIYEWAKELGARPQFDINMTPQDDGSRDPLALQIDDEEQLFALLNDTRLFPQAKQTKLVPETDMICESVKPEGIKKKRHFCDAGKNLAGISPYGDVYPCIQWRIVAGNVRDKSFTQIWREAETLTWIRQLNHKDVHMCAECEVQAYCGRCPGVAQLFNGSALGPGGRSCDMAHIRKKMIEGDDVMEMLSRESEEKELLQHDSANVVAVLV